VLHAQCASNHREYQRTSDLPANNPDILLFLTVAGPTRRPSWNIPGQIHRPIKPCGIMFATRLAMSDEHSTWRVDTPSVLPPNGMLPFRMTAFRPLTFNQDTEERDAEIILAAKQSRGLNMPVLAIGDFNDVAWSDTTSLFKSIGSFLDPRIGRGRRSADKTGLAGH
jgi:hypothetical protein